MGSQKENICELGCIIWLHCFLCLQEKGALDQAEDMNIDEHIGYTLASDDMFHGPESVSQIRKTPSPPTPATYCLSKCWLVARRCGQRLALKISLFFLSFRSPVCQRRPRTSEGI